MPALGDRLKVGLDEIEKALDAYMILPHPRNQQISIQKKHTKSNKYESHIDRLKVGLDEIEKALHAYMILSSHPTNQQIFIAKNTQNRTNMSPTSHEINEVDQI